VNPIVGSLFIAVVAITNPTCFAPDANSNVDLAVVRELSSDVIELLYARGIPYADL